MRILVFVKAVPDISELKFEQGKTTLARGTALRVLGYDRRALEEALLLKEKHGGSVSVVCMGPSASEEALKPLLAMGADKAYLLSDPAFAGGDTLATAVALAAAARKIGFDLIIGGQRSLDSETGQLLPEVAQVLGTSLATSVNKEEYIDGKFLVERESEEGYELLELKPPATMSVTERMNKPRVPSAEAIEKSKQSQVTKFSAAELGLEARTVGAAGSPTSVKTVREEPYKRNPVIVDASQDPAPALAKAFEAVQALLRERPAPHRRTSARMAKKPRPVWVVFLRGRVETETGLEALSKVKELGLLPVAVMVGTGDDSLRTRAADSGAYALAKLETDGEARSSSVCSGALVQGVKKERPYAILIPSTVFGREVAGRVAAELKAGLTGDAIDISLDESDELVMTKPAFGGNLVADISSKGVPKMATVRPGSWHAKQHLHQAIGMSAIPTSPVQADVKVSSTRVTVDFAKGHVPKGLVVIGVGSGVGSTEAFDSVRKYGAELGIPVLATRKLIDNGWAPPQLQVGLTGRHLLADLYVAVAVSGAPYHLVGLKRSRVLLAINNDPNAPIFKFSDVGIVGDYKVILPLIADELSKLVAASKPAITAPWRRS